MREGVGYLPTLSAFSKAVRITGGGEENGEKKGRGRDKDDEENESSVVYSALYVRTPKANAVKIRH